MQLVGTILLALGACVAIIGEFKFIVAAFRVGPEWGFACLWLPLVDWIFLLLFWLATKRPFFIAMCGHALFLSGAALGGDLPLS